MMIDRKSTLFLFVLLFCLLAGSSLAHAQIDGPHWGLGMNIGKGWLDEQHFMQDRAIYGWHVGWYPQASWGLEAVYEYLNSYRPVSPSGSRDFFNYGVQAVWCFRPVHRVQPVLLAGTGGVSTNIDDTVDHSLALTLGGGVRAHVSRQLVFCLESKLFVGNFDGEYTQEFSFSAGMSVLWGRDADDDGDGVSNYRDQCPRTPRGAIVDERGCPLDDDLDGVPNGIDECPETPARVRVDDHGCPMNWKDPRGGA